MKNNVYSRIYKLCYVFSWLIAFFIGGIFYSITCNAQALPSIDSSVFATIQGSNQGLIDVGFLPQNIVPNSSISTSQWSPWNLGYTLLTQIDIDDCTITALDDSQKSALLSKFFVVDVNGTSLSIDNNIYCVEYDNGYFTGQCYVDSNGKMLAYTNDLGGHLLQSRFGGGIKDIQDWEDMYEDVSQDIYSNSFILYDHPEVVGNNAVTYYLFYGQEKYSRPYQASELYIPNQYQIGVIIPTVTTNGATITEWYCNNLKAYVYHEVMGPFNDGNYTPFTVTPGTYNFQGVTYNYKLHYANAQAPNNTYDAWLQGQNVNNRYFASQGYIYNSSLANNNQAIPFKPIDNQSQTNIFNYNYYYDPESIKRLQSELNNLNNSINQNFNNQQQISEQNFPYYYPLGDTDILPSELPFPGIENYPGYEPLPVPQTDPFLQYDPLNQPSNEDIETSINNFGIPFFSNLQYKYPFSIPWDIKSFIYSFKAEPTPPAWDFDWNITVGNTTYTHHFEGDLSDFNGLAVIFRNLLLISFIIGLCVFSYNHHF